jgi:hypothetical protein
VKGILDSSNQIPGSEERNLPPQQGGCSAKKRLTITSAVVGLHIIVVGTKNAWKSRLAKRELTLLCQYKY